MSDPYDQMAIGKLRHELEDCRRRLGELEEDETVRNPETPQEWQDAANTAEMLLLIESARAYGLITGGPQANVERCRSILIEARRRGYEPQ